VGGETKDRVVSKSNRTDGGGRDEGWWGEEWSVGG
jgi:hypothetical protein